MAMWFPISLLLLTAQLKSTSGKNAMEYIEQANMNIKTTDGDGKPTYSI